ncbi:class A beta-lactamase [Spirosoma sp. HMF3257]|uniref:Beta-lactamase n=1 Tax=Spirosoma telluris TaxID=2183553 RepID=A0A327NS46_9BACT|nr:class A beta-lactamase [Spirosoma telluris]RAI78180.1 serine hydrolase [Spirosoma telluris]
MTKFLLWAIPILFSASLNAQQTANHSITRLRTEIEQLAQAAQGRVGVTATVLETGASVNLNGDQQFPMQSVYKLPIGMAVLQQVDQGKLALSQTVHVTPDEYISKRQHSPLRDKYPTGADVSVAELLRYAVSESDGSASDVLLRLLGGAKTVMASLKKLDITGIIVANTEKEIGSDNAVQYRNWATPTEVVALLRAVENGRNLSASSRTLLLHLLTETETGLHRLKGLLPAGTVVAHKTGTSWTIEGLTAATNDVGLITLPSGKHIAIAVFVSDSKADQVIRERVIAQIAQVVWNHWHSH